MVTDHWSVSYTFSVTSGQFGIDLPERIRCHEILGLFVDIPDRQVCSACFVPEENEVVVGVVTITMTHKHR